MTFVLNMLNIKNPIATITSKTPAAVNIRARFFFGIVSTFRAIRKKDSAMTAIPILSSQPPGPAANPLIVCFKGLNEWFKAMVTVSAATITAGPT
jgi:hypothetical protein